MSNVSTTVSTTDLATDLLAQALALPATDPTPSVLGDWADWGIGGDPLTEPLTAYELAANWSNWGLAPDGKYTSPSHSNRYIVLGMPVTALLRYMGHTGFKPKQARQVLEALGCHGVSDSTIGCQLTGGRKGATGKGSRGKIPMLTDEQVATLELALVTV